MMFVGFVKILQADRFFFELRLFRIQFLTMLLLNNGKKTNISQL